MKKLIIKDFKQLKNILDMAKHHTNDDAEVIIIPVDQLPTEGAHSTWYLYNGDYYYWDFTTNSFVNEGGERPTKPPHNA